MAANVITFQEFWQAFRDFVLNIVFVVGLIIGFFLSIGVCFIVSHGTCTIWNIVISFVFGTATGYYSNYLWEKHKKKQRGEKPYLTTTTSHNNIFIEGQFPNTESNKNTIRNLDLEDP